MSKISKTEYFQLWLLNKSELRISMQETCYRKYELSELNTSKPRKIKSFKGTVVNSLRSKNNQS